MEILEVDTAWKVGFKIRYNTCWEILYCAHSQDESNNTPDTIDRNILYGQIFIQPTRTAEFIVLDFVVQPTGAAFPE